MKFLKRCTLHIKKAWEIFRPKLSVKSGQAIIVGTAGDLESRQEDFKQFFLNPNLHTDEEPRDLNEHVRGYFLPQREGESTGRSIKQDFPTV